MNKHRLITRFGFDGVTIAAAPTDYALVDGWTQGTLTGPVGILPAGLWGKVPAGDPYLAHINVLSPDPLAVGDFFELQSGTPVQPRVQYVPWPDNTRLILVRPTDRLRLFVQPQAVLVIEMLIESIGGVNELGSRLAEWSARASGTSAGVRAVTVAAPTVLPAWTGLLHVVHDSVNADVITLPPRALVPLDAVLTVTRKGTGVPTLAAAGADRIAVDMMVEQVNRSVTLYNNGDRWALTGV
jgi:hypothetical protein